MATGPDDNLSPEQRASVNAAVAAALAREQRAKAKRTVQTNVVVRTPLESKVEVTEDDIALLIERLGQARQNDARPIMDRLVECGAAAVPALREAVWSKNPRLRRRIPRVLLRLNVVAAADDLVELLDDPNIKVEIHALRALAEFGLPQHADIFARYIDEHTADLVVHALRGLELADAERAVASCRKLAADRRPEMRATAIGILDRIAPHELRPFVDGLCADKIINIRQIGFSWLAEFNPERALRESMEALGNDRDIVMHAQLVARIVAADRGSDPTTQAQRKSAMDILEQQIARALEAPNAIPTEPPASLLIQALVRVMRSNGGTPVEIR